MPVIRSLLLDAAKQLGFSSPSPRLDAEVLLAFALGIGRAKLLSKMDEVIGNDREVKFNELLERRRRQEPIAYIIGVKEFWSLEFEVTPAVLIPRPETELLVERALRVFKERPGADSILDLGTGSGCIAVALAVELVKQGRSFKLVASDKSEAALKIARRNVLRHGLQNQIELVQSDWFLNLKPAGRAFDLIVCNPPYVAEAELQASADLQYEPPEALCGGIDGLAEIRRVLDSLVGYLKPAGVFICEIGFNQRAEVESIITALKASGGSLFDGYTFLKDLAGCDRVLELQKSSLL